MLPRRAAGSELLLPRHSRPLLLLLLLPCSTLLL
jgi:hypothetical protein